MNSEEQLHCIALTQVPGIGHIWARKLIDIAGSATDVFRLRGELPGVTPRVSEMLDCPQAIERAKAEYDFACRNHIRCLPYHDEAYPARLRECEDAPVMLYYRGNADLNAARIVNMVGTRHATEYGMQLCASFLCELKTLCPDTLVVSGLAYGIDIHAHRAALSNALPTVGVLAHGLDRIYPPAHRHTAVEMLNNGGLLTEFPSGSAPDRYNFVSRNRIVAGMSDATIVVESAEKGGSLITAEIAESYQRECFAFPGRVGDEYSAGCNQLIRANRATLLLSASDFTEAMGWLKSTSERKNVQRALFVDLTEEETRVTDVLRRMGDLQINALVAESDIAVQKMNAILFELEMKGVVRVLAGGVYRLL